MKRNLIVLGAVTFSILMNMNVQIESRNIQSPQPAAQQNKMDGTKNNNVAGVSNNNTTNHRHASVQPAPSHHRSKNFVPQRQDFKAKMLPMFDTDHDGKINSSERAQMRKERQKHRHLQSTNK